jgi:hypothetical protein
MATFPSKVNYATGDILTATNMNDVGGAINLLESAQFAAGKNKIINGDFGVWQRGTTGTLSGSTPLYVADRFQVQTDGAGGTITVSQQTFTPGTAPVAGYEGQFFHRVACTVARTGTTFSGIYHKIEDVRTLAGQTVTLSFWAKADSARTITGNLEQNFGSGGSASVFAAGFSISATTAWTRFTYTVALASITGKTVGTSSYLNAYIDLPKNTTYTLDIWGVQLEAASTASNFQTATGTKQGELAACQRYYWRNTADSTGDRMGLLGTSGATTDVSFTGFSPVPMRTTPSSLDYADLTVNDGSGSPITVSALAIQSACAGSYGLTATVTGATQFRPYFLRSSSATAYFGLSAEL